MRSTLVLLLSLLFVLTPKTAKASEDRLHGQWQVVAMEMKGKRVAAPRKDFLDFQFDKGDHSWKMCVYLDKKPDCIGGTWTLQGEDLTLKHDSDRVDAKVAWEGQELKLTMRPPTKRNQAGQRVTMLAKRKGGKSTRK